MHVCVCVFTIAFHLCQATTFPLVIIIRQVVFYSQPRQVRKIKPIMFLLLNILPSNSTDVITERNPNGIPQTCILAWFGLLESSLSTPCRSDLRHCKSNIRWTPAPVQHLPPAEERFYKTKRRIIPSRGWKALSNSCSTHWQRVQRDIYPLETKHLSSHHG